MADTSPQKGSAGRIGDTTAEESTDDLEPMAQSTSRKLVILLAAGGLVLLLLHTSPMSEMVRDRKMLTAIIQSGDMWAKLNFVLISSLMIMVGTPRLFFYALGGFAFGLWEGLFLSLLSTLTGSFLTFRVARWGGKEWLTARFGNRRFFRKIVNAKPTVASVALMRLLPVSNIVINAGLAVSFVENRAFLLGSLIGSLPQGVVAVIIGSGIAADVPWAGALQIGTAGSLLLVLYFWTFRKRREHP